METRTISKSVATESTEAKDIPKRAVVWIVYPPPSPIEYRPGDTVFLRPKSAKEIGRVGTVVDASSEGGKDSERSNATAGGGKKIKVRFPILPRRRRRRGTAVAEVKSPAGDADLDSTSGKKSYYEAYVRPGRLVLRYRTHSTTDEDVDGEGDVDVDGDGDGDGDGTIVIVTERTDQYRILAASQILPHDKVLEIGCSNGECSRVIAKHLVCGATGLNIGGGGSLVGFDTSSLMIQEARDKMKTMMLDMLAERRTVSSPKHEGSANGDDGRGGETVEFHRIDPFTDPKRALHLATACNVPHRQPTSTTTATITTTTSTTAPDIPQTTCSSSTNHTPPKKEESSEWYPGPRTPSPPVSSLSRAKNWRRQSCRPSLHRPLLPIVQRAVPPTTDRSESGLDRHRATTTAGTKGRLSIVWDARE